MESQVFILSGNGVLDERCPEASGQQATLVLFRDESGAVSFNTSEAGLHVLQAILQDAVVVGSDAELRGLRDCCDLTAFHATVLGRAGLCVYGPDFVFKDNVEKCKAYIRDVARSKLLMKYGREVPPLIQPLLHKVFFDRKFSSSELSWIAGHSKAFAVWRCVSGAEVQPILIGPGQTEILSNVKATCEIYSVNVKEVHALAELPNW